ncbi:MAG: type II secretion system F family protein, partial [Zoogloeaceae bacterium]|nr:type II secretion system F family protein [Zoogloeaceae bacterium]
MRYRYRAMNAAGRKVRGQCESGSLMELENRLKARGLDLIVATESPVNRYPGCFGKRRVPRREWLHFWFQLRELLAAGIAIQEALTDLAGTEDVRQRLVIEALLDGIAKGETLSGAMAAEGSFNPVAIALIHAGEMAGRLPEAIGKLLDELQREDDLFVMARRVL